MRTLAVVVALMLSLGCAPIQGPGSTVDKTPAGEVLPPARRDPVAVGDTAPDFALVDQLGNSVTSAEPIAAGGAVLLFVPSLDDPSARPLGDWIRRNRQLFQKQSRAELIVIAGGAAEANAAAAQAAELRAAVLTDAAGATSRSYGLAKGSATTVRQPWTIVIGADGRIHLAQPAIAPPADVITALSTLPGARRDGAFDLLK